MFTETKAPLNVKENGGGEENMPPHVGKFIAYYRVSTRKQGESGLGLDAQKEIVAAHLNGGRWKLIDEFTEIESGKKSDRHRPELRKALEKCKAENATLIIAKLDRLTRNVGFLSTLLEAGEPFIACDIPDFGNPAQNKFMLTMMANVAEYEANVISMRTKAALAAAKKRGVKLGTPDPMAGSRKGTEKIKKNADEFAVETYAIIKELKKYGCETLEEIAKGLKARGVKTRRGKVKWYPSSVKNIIKRATKGID
jgi:DNA invertase Pin-like site-specific DNA recombinase